MELKDQVSATRSVTYAHSAILSVLMKLVPGSKEELRAKLETFRGVTLGTTLTDAERDEMLRILEGFASTD